MEEIKAATGGDFRPVDYFKITVFGFAVSALWGSLHTIVLPMRLLDFVVASSKNTYLGLLTLSGLLLAMLVQPIAGLVSDRSGFRWGRRRPYILAGTVITLLFLPGIGLAGGYAAIFTIYCLLQVSTNTAQGPYQALIPDLVPAGRRGVASGVKGLLEIIGGLGLVYLIVYAGNYFASEGVSWLWVVLGILAMLLLAAMLVNVITVRERPALPEAQPPLLSTLYKSFQINLRADSGFILFLISRLLFTMALTTIQAFAFYFIQDVVGAADPAKTTSEVLVAVGAGLIIAVYPAGRISDRVGRKPVLVTSGILGSTGMLFLFFVPSYAYVLAGAGLIGVAGGIFLSTNWALATDLVPKSEEARYLGLANMATAGGSALARLVGPVIDFFNRQSAGTGYQVMLLMCLAYFVIASLLIIKIRTRN